MVYLDIDFIFNIIVNSVVFFLFFLLTMNFISDVP